MITLLVPCLAYFQCLCQNNKHFSIYVSVWVFPFFFFVCVNIFVTKYRERCKFNFPRIDLGKSLGKTKDIFKGLYAHYKIIFQITCTSLHSIRRKSEYLFQFSLAKKCLTFKFSLFDKQRRKSHFNLHFLKIPG